MFVRALKVKDIADGGMIAVRIEGRDIIVCNYNNKFFALDKRCSHMSASLETGTLDGYILTCPLHFAQFDITTGEALSGPIPPENRIHDLKTYPVQVEGDSIKVDVSKTL
jgi:nitrite reductase/ring-hydroxylating ferredoxin subunit